MKLSIAVLQSLDGYLARSHADDLSWATSEDRTFFKEYTTQVGTMIMGSTTFNNMKGIKGSAFKNRKCLVFTSEPEKYADYKTEFGPVEFFKGSVSEAVAKLDAAGVTSAVVIGGGKLIQQFLSAKLVQEIYITIAPQIFGQGIKVCDGEIGNLNMQLLDYKKISANEILLHYKILDA